jgi:diguanylate cyclase (GGDEF)-like protein
MQPKRAVILIVDDSPLNIELLAELLSEENEVIFATSGAEALSLAEIQSPDLILLDVVMPDMDGYQVCEALKGNPLTKAIPVIFVSGMNQEADEKRGLEVGAIDYIFKPIRAAVVRARVRNHLELSRYRVLLEHLSTTDGLTGIANRRCFDETLLRECRRAQRQATELALVICDVDHFKDYNDSQGHLAGDDCLKRVAAALRDGVRRPADLVARFGGEEFAVLLPDTSLLGAVQVAERLRGAVVDCAIPHGRSTTAPVVTISLGVSCAGPAPDSLQMDVLTGEADRCLYLAKRRGRNCVVAGAPDRATAELSS